MKKQHLLLGGLSASLMAVATPALAHVGPHAENSLMAGFSHPLGGLDHLLAMLAVGGFAALQKDKLQQAVPATFMLMLMVGFVGALNGLQLPLVEGTIATSVLVLGLMVASMRQLPALVSMPLVGLFAMSHGFAHGAELGAATALTFAVGFMVASLALHIAGGTLMARLLSKMPTLTRIAGAAMALTGAGLLTSL